MVMGIDRIMHSNMIIMIKLSEAVLNNKTVSVASS